MSASDGGMVLTAQEAADLRTACRTHDPDERINALLRLGCRFGIEKPEPR